jgi:predicted O-linked N-acetylglucosamine transferase (SPINDLY family)
LPKTPRQKWIETKESWERSLHIEVPAALPAAPPRPGGLRVAYLSPDFRIHPLAYLIPELLERHDRKRFEVIGISLGPPDGSDIRARLVAALDQFHDVHASSDEDVVTLLRRLEVDLVVDLAGYTQHAVPQSWRTVSPLIQASYLGCGTSGSDFIDYLLVDRIAVPPEQQRFFTEKLAYLPDSFMVADSAAIQLSGRVPWLAGGLRTAG